MAEFTAEEWARHNFKVRRCEAFGVALKQTNSVIERIGSLLKYDKLSPNAKSIWNLCWKQNYLWLICCEGNCEMDDETRIDDTKLYKFLAFCIRNWQGILVECAVLGGVMYIYISSLRSVMQ